MIFASHPLTAAGSRRPSQAAQRVEERVLHEVVELVVAPQDSRCDRRYIGGIAPVQRIEVAWIHERFDRRGRGGRRTHEAQVWGSQAHGIDSRGCFFSLVP